MSIGRWLSAALDDPQVCEEMKTDIRAWFDAGEPALPSDSGKAAPVLPEELETLIAGTSANRAADAILQNYTVTHRNSALAPATEGGESCDCPKMCQGPKPGCEHYRSPSPSVGTVTHSSADRGTEA